MCPIHKRTPFTVREPSRRSDRRHYRKALAESRHRTSTSVMRAQLVDAVPSATYRTLPRSLTIDNAKAWFGSIGQTAMRNKKVGATLFRLAGVRDGPAADARSVGVAPARARTRR